MSDFIKESINKSIFELLIHLSNYEEFKNQDKKIFDFSYYPLNQMEYPWRSGRVLKLEYQSFNYANTITKQELEESLICIIRHNVFMVFGGATLGDNLEIHIACFDQKTFDGNF